MISAALIRLLPGLPIFAGLVWLIAYTDVIRSIYSVLPGALLLGGGVSALLLRGDCRTPQVVAMGALIGIVSAICLVASIDFWSFICLLSLSVGSLFVAGRGFGIYPPLADVSENTRPLTVAAKAALDEVALGAVIRLMLRSPDATLMDNIAEESHEAITLLDKEGFLDAPTHWHHDPVMPENINFTPASFRGLDYQKMSFNSGYQAPIELPGFERWQGFENNRTAHGVVLRHPGQPRPWMMCIHGGGMGDDVFNLIGMQAAKFHRDHGLNVILPVLPLHGRRRIGKMNGVGLIGGHMTNTLFGLSQTAWDLRQMLAWVREQGEPRVGLYGISLGGYTTALLSSLESNLACAVAGIPASQLAPMILKLSEPRFSSGLAERGIGFKEIERLFTVISPLAMKPQIEIDKRYIFAGIADRMVPANHVAELWRHWDKCSIAWYQGSHVTWRWESPAQRMLDEAVGKHLQICQ
jgi:dienelactone hydrolase